jgi:signal transduction histidine kinase/CheY-like chemotaxis protein
MMLIIAVKNALHLRLARSAAAGSICLLLLALFYFGQAFAQTEQLAAEPSVSVYRLSEPLHVSAAQPFRLISQHVSRWQEAMAGFSPGKIEGVAWQHIDDVYANLDIGRTDLPQWFRLELKNDSDEPLSLVFMVLSPLLDYLDVYRQNQLDHPTYQLGDTLPYAQRVIDHPLFLIPMDLAAREQTIVYFRVKHQGVLLFPLFIAAEEQMWAQQLQDSIFRSLVYGVFVSLVIYSLYLYFVGRERSVIPFIGFILSSLLVKLILDGHAYMLWPTAVVWQQIAFDVMSLLELLCLLLFSWYFLELDRQKRFSIITVLFTLIAALAVLLLMLLIGLQEPVPGVAELFIVADVLVIAVAGFKAYQGNRLAYLLSVPLAFLTITTIYFSTSRYQVDWLFFYRETMLIPSALALIVIAIAMTVKISLRKKDREQYEKALQMVALENTVKSDFIAKMSHEIRTPMNGIIGMNDVLENSTLDDRQRRMTRVIRQSGEDLLKVLNNILDFAKIDAGKMECEMIPFDCQSLLSEEFSSLQRKKGGKDIVFRCNLDEKVDCLIGDPAKLQFIIRSLLSNALKFTESGSIVLAGGRDNAGVYFKVNDSGVGMSQEALDRLFKPFEKVHHSSDRAHRGAGLELSICKRYVDMLGGSIAVYSEPRRGTCFTVRLPWDRADQNVRRRFLKSEPNVRLNSSAVKNFSADDYAAFSVLVVEDNPANQMIINTMLEHIGVSSSLASDGQQALECIEAGERFDLIFMDCEMPVMNGFVASEKIREIEQNRGLKRQTVIALSAHTDSHFARRCYQAGMDAVLAKPFKSADIKATIQRVLRAANS